MMKAIARCDCGALEIHVSNSPIVQLVCHCKDCQKFSGLEFVEGAFFRKEDCRITGNTKHETLRGGTGEDKLQHFCSSCSSPVYVQIQALNGAIAISASRLSPFEFRAEVHVWASQKAEGIKIPEGMTQVPGMPPKEIVGRMINGFWNQ